MVPLSPGLTRPGIEVLGTELEVLPTAEEQSGALPGEFGGDRIEPVGFQPLIDEIGELSNILASSILSLKARKF